MLGLGIHLPNFKEEAYELHHFQIFKLHPILLDPHKKNITAIKAIKGSQDFKWDRRAASVADCITWSPD